MPTLGVVGRVASGAWDGTWKFEILAGDTRKERSLRRSCLRGVPLVGNLSWRKGWQSLASGCCKIPVKRCCCVKILGSEFAYSVVFAGKQDALFLYFIQRYNIYMNSLALSRNVTIFWWCLQLLNISQHLWKRSRLKRYLISSFVFIVDAQAAFNYTQPSGKLRIRCNK